MEKHISLKFGNKLMRLIPKSWCDNVPHFLNKQLAYQSPLKILYQKEPSYSHLRVFGCLCYPLFPSTTINKLQARSTPCVFLGYPSNHRGYKCYDLYSRKIIISRHVIFDETQFPFAKLHSPQPYTYDFMDDGPSPYVIHHLASQPSPSQPTQHDLPNPQPTTQPTTPETQHAQSPPSSSPNPSPSTSATSSPPYQPTPISVTKPVTRSQHGIFKPKRQLNLNTSVPKSPLPRNPVSALRDPNCKMAIDDEFNALIKNKTWELVPRPPDVNVIRSMWIFTHKEKSDGVFERHKARLVGDGKTQQVGVDCGETFSPVVKPTTVRTILSLALSKAWSIH